MLLNNYLYEVVYVSAFDRIIKRERKAKYKRLRKLRKARDNASKYIGRKLLLSDVFKYYKFHYGKDENLFLSNLSKDIFDNYKSILGEDRPPKPPSMRVRAKK